TSPTMRWTGKVGDASVFRVWGSRTFVRDTSADKLSSHAIPCVFLGFPPDMPSWQFYHPTLRRVLPSQDVTFDESVPFYRLFPYRTAPLPPPRPLFLAPSPPSVDPLPPQGPAPSSVSQVDPLFEAVSVEVAVDSGAHRGAASGVAASGGAAFGGDASRDAEPASVEPRGAELEGAEPGGAEPGGAEPGGAEPGGTEPEGAEPGSAESEGAESWGAGPRGTASAGGPAGTSPRLSPRREPLSPRQLNEWFAQCTRLRNGATRAGGSAAGGTGAGGAGATTLGGAGVTAAAGGTGGAGVASLGGARTRGTGAAGAGGFGGAGARDPSAGSAGAGGTGAGGAGAGALELEVADLLTGGTGAGGAGARGAGAGDPGAGDAGAGGTGTGGAGAAGAEAAGAGAGGTVAGGTGAGGTVPQRLFFVPPPPSSLPPPNSPESCPALPVRAVCTGCRVPRTRPPPVLVTHIMALRPSSVPLRVPLPPPPASSLPAVRDPESDLARAASPTVPRLLATVVTDPSFEPTTAYSLVAELVDFAAACRLDYVTSLVADSEADCPPSVGGECALGMDVLEDRQKDFECLAAAVPHLVAMLLAPEEDPDAPDIPTPRSYTEAMTGPYSSQWQIAMDFQGEAAAEFSACLQGSLRCTRLQTVLGS
ncbi:unnamed protein product, partial [Closterium sp. NIES-53]